MKKILVLSLLAMMACQMSVLARVKYDSTGRTIIYDDTIRGQQRAQQARQIEQKRQGMAAAKIDYGYTKSQPDRMQNNLKDNYIQNRK